MSIYHPCSNILTHKYQIAVESLNKIDGEGAPRFLNNAYEFWIPADDESKDSLVGQVKAVGFLQQDAVRYSIKPNIRHQPSGMCNKEKVMLRLLGIRETWISMLQRNRWCASRRIHKSVFV